MAVTKITYPTKSNVSTDPDNVRKFEHGDANEIKDVVNNNADEIQALLDSLGISVSSNFIGLFVSLAVLQAAYPNGANGSYAIIDDGLGGTPQVATYNDTTDLWEVSVADQSIIWVANQAALPGPGVSQKLYIALDSGAFYYWTGAQYETAGPTVDVITKYIANNGGHYYTEKGYGNIGNGFEQGDVIRYRDPATKKLSFYYVEDPNLTLPADFADRVKLDKYNLTGPMLS